MDDKTHRFSLEDISGEEEPVLEEAAEQMPSLEPAEGEMSLEDLIAEAIILSGEPEYEPEEPQTSQAPEEPAPQPEPFMGDTIRLDVNQIRKAAGDSMGDTIRMDPIPADTRKDPLSPGWEPEYDQPMGQYIPPQPIVFRPKSRLHELKRKLVAGPEKRYYDISERGFGKLQAAMFLSFLVVVLSGIATGMYAMGMVQPERLKLMVFSQFFAMLISALLGSFQLMEGVADLFKGRFSLNTMLIFTFGVCLADGIFCLQEQRVPCCAAFSLQVFMSLWGEYHRRSTEMGQMDTMRKAVRLHSIVRCKPYFEKYDGLLRSEGEVEDFMDYYNKPSGPEKAMSCYCILAILLCAACGVVAGRLHGSVSFGLQVSAISLLGAVPVTSFIMLSRPMAILEKKLHALGAVLCGWRGIKGMCGKTMFPVSHEDLFPVGTCRMNGVKFYGETDPDTVAAYATAIIAANGGGLAPLFNQLLDSRSGRHYEAENLRAYGGGLGGEVCGEPVLVGVASFLQEMGVEIPEGTRVSQAVYVAVDGELSGLFALNYVKERSVAMGLRALCSYRRLRPVLTTSDFMLTENFIRSKFGINIRRMLLPERSVRSELAAIEPDKEAAGLALVTNESLASFAYAVAGARSVRSAWVAGTVVHVLVGLLGIAIMAILAVLGERELLTPANVLAYELIWMIPGLLISEWTRAV